MKLSDNVYMLRLTVSASREKQYIYPVILKDNKSLTLIDTGFPGMIPEIYEALDKEWLDKNKIDKIIITHHDIDHIGNARILLKENRNKVKILAHEKEKDYIDGIKEPLKLSKIKQNDNMSKEAVKIFEGMKRGFAISYLSVDITLKDKQFFDIAGGVTVIHTPGHTHGHISLYLNRDKILIAGDSLDVVNDNLVLLDDNYNFDSELNKKSILKYLDYDIEKIICYHGGLYTGEVKKTLKRLAGV